MQTNKLGLTIPEQINSKPKSDISVAAIETWRSQLKTADTDETTQSIFKMLQELNSTVIAPNHRFQLLELLRPITQVINQLLKKHYVNRTQPLSPTKLTTIELSRTLQTEMLNGYKIIIDNITNESNTNAKNETLPNAIYRAFNHFNNILYSYYQLYTQQPENIWKEMHILYQCAENYNITATPVNLDISENNKNPTVITPYKLALFLSAAHPYQWRQSEQDILSKYAGLWDEFITIRNLKAKDRTNNSIFFIPVSEDFGPFPITIEKKAPADDTGFVLDLSNLIDYLKKTYENPKNIPATETEAAIYSLQKLIAYLIAGQKRNLERFSIMGQVSAAFGSLATHYHINQRKLFKPDNVDGDESEESNMQELQLGAEAVLDDAATVNKSEFKADTFLYKCNLINIHGEGAGITFQDISFPPIQPGEIVAMTISLGDTDLDESHWNIGTVRWLKHNRQNKLTAGLQILAPFAMAAAIQSLKDNTAGFFQRSLLLKDNTSQTTFNVITPILQFDVGKKVRIYSYYHKEFFETELKELLSSNNNFKCFATKIPFKPKKSTPAKPNINEL
ncbi:MAG: hypothetical protein ABSA84_05930 [Gammaproteobacteria bacterium]|jgi:hypothetical protein